MKGAEGKTRQKCQEPELEYQYVKRILVKSWQKKVSDWARPNVHEEEYRKIDDLEEIPSISHHSWSDWRLVPKSES